MNKTVESASLSDPAINPHELGIATRHTRAFRFDRPNGGIHLSLLMCFRTPAVIFTTDGLTEVVPGDCIIHSPQFPLLHYSVSGASDGFRNDWLHVRADIVKKAMKTSKLPWDKVLSTGHPDLFENDIKLLMEELSSPDEFSEDAIGAIILTMTLRIARALREGRNQSLQHLPGYVHFEAMRDLRTQMLAEFKRPWTVKKMAHEMNLSPERFSALYRMFFGKSPVSEIIDARMNNASRLLCYSGLPVKEIAHECGIDDEHYFSRLFKRRNGVTPQEWRHSGKRVKQ